MILDEINLALTFNLLPPEEVFQVLRERPPWVEVVLTGRQAPPELVETGGPGHGNAAPETLLRGRGAGPARHRVVGALDYRRGCRGNAGAMPPGRPCRVKRDQGGRFRASTKSPKPA